MSFAGVTYNKTQSSSPIHQASASKSESKSSSAEKKYVSMDSLKKLKNCKLFTKTKDDGDGGNVPLQVRSAQHTNERRQQTARHHRKKSPVDLLECVDGIEKNATLIIQKDKEVRALTDRCETQDQQIKTLEKQIADLSEQAKLLESECCIEGEENKALKCEIERLRHRLDTQTSVSFLEDTNSEEETIANYKRALTTLKKQIDDLNDDTIKLRGHSKEQSRQILKLRQQADMTGLMENQIKSEVAIRQKAEEERERLREELKKANMTVNTLQTERKVLDAELKAMKEESARFIEDQNQFNELRKKHATLVDEHEQVLKSMRAMGTLSAQLAESEKAVRTLEHQLETTRLAHGNAQLKVKFEKEERDREIDHSKITGHEKIVAQSKRYIQQDVSTYQEDYEGIKKQLVEHKESLSAIEVLNEKLNKEVQLARERCQGLEQDMQAKSSQVKQYAKKVECLKQQIAAQGSAQAAGNTSTRVQSSPDETQCGTGIAKLNELYKTAQDDNEQLSSENSELYNEVEKLKRDNIRLMEQLRVSNKVQGEDSDCGQKVQARLLPEGVRQMVSSSTSPSNEYPSKIQQASSIESQQAFSAPLQVASHSPDTASTLQSLPDQFTGNSSDISVMQQANGTHGSHLAPSSKAGISPKPLHREPITKFDAHELVVHVISESPSQPSPPVDDSIIHGEAVSIEDSITQFENPLVKELDDEIHQQAAEVIQEVGGGRQAAKTDHQRPFDPNLVCPMCRRQFRIGEIQKFKRHVNTCTGTDD